MWNRASSQVRDLALSSGAHHWGNTSLGMGWQLRTESIFAIASSAIMWVAWTVAVPICGVMMTLLNFNKGCFLQETAKTAYYTQKKQKEQLSHNKLILLLVAENRPRGNSNGICIKRPRTQEWQKMMINLLSHFSLLSTSLVYLTVMLTWKYG